MHSLCFSHTSFKNEANIKVFLGDCGNLLQSAFKI